MNPQKKLREGFSTGSAATAAGMAALELLLNPAQNMLGSMLIPLPPQDGVLSSERLEVPILSIDLINKNQALGIVKKDGGDDPDATNGAHIHVQVSLNPNDNNIKIDGGQGVGRFTLPGLPLPVGEAAINPAPRLQIRAGLEIIAKKYGYEGGIELCISVPKGEEIAKHTFNPRLGIIGGISILGTQGTVKPFSHKAWKATISQGLQVAHATNCTTVCLSTGRRSERLLLAKYKDIPAQAAVQVADFAQFSLQEAAQYNFEYIYWACFFGKLVKLAQGHAYTHAHGANIDFELLSNWCADYSLCPKKIEEIKSCVTANHALEIILQSDQHAKILENITKKAKNIAENFAGKKIKIHLFHLDGRSLIIL